MISSLLQNLRTDARPAYEHALQHLDDAVLEHILLRVLRALPSEKLPEFETLLKKDDPMALEVFLARELPDLKTYVKDEVEEVERSARQFLSALGA